MIDHLNLPVGDLDRAVAFYTEALAPLGIHTVMHVPADPGSGQKAMHAFGAGPKPFFWAAALAAGATPLRPPGLCPEYHSDYYGAFAGDPDGINVEAVCHRAPHPRR